MQLQLCLEDLKAERIKRREADENKRRKHELEEWQRQKRRRSLEKKRRSEMGERLREYKKEQADIRAERQFRLHKELKIMARQKREKALHDFIRVNFRYRIPTHAQI